MAKNENIENHRIDKSHTTSLDAYFMWILEKWKSLKYGTIRLWLMLIQLAKWYKHKAFIYSITKNEKRKGKNKYLMEINPHLKSIGGH